MQATKSKLYMADYAIPIEDILMKIGRGAPLNQDWIDSAIGPSMIRYSEQIMSETLDG